jgi:hypothetical protein
LPWFASLTDEADAASKYAGVSTHPCLASYPGCLLSAYYSQNEIHTIAVTLLNALLLEVLPQKPCSAILLIPQRSVLLLGPLLALMTLYPMPSQKAAPGKRSVASTGRAFGGALLSFFSVGCPVCNKVVVLLLGLGGAMTIFNPLRPFLGLASIVLLAVALFLRVRVVRYGCRLPAQKTVANEEG